MLGQKGYNVLIRTSGNIRGDKGLSQRLAEQTRLLGDWENKKYEWKQTAVMRHKKIKELGKEL